MLRKFNETFAVPDVCKEYINHMVEQEEIELVVAMDMAEFTLIDVMNKMNLSRPLAEQLIERAYKRGILNKVNDKQATYICTDLYTRLKYAAVFDDYENIPLEARNKIDSWYLNAFIEKHSDNFNKLREGKLDLHEASFLFAHTPSLLEQVYEVIEEADRIVAIPCDCNQLSKHRTAKKPVLYCIHFNNYADDFLKRGLGKALTKEECKEVVKNANKEGFMQCININFKTAGPGFICNCNPKWCYPYRAAEIMGSQSYYPLKRNVANYNSEQCISCGLCIKRCPFNAFSYGDGQIRIKGKLKKQITFDSTICQGCGLCANTCPSKSISMINI
ncbi:MAG: hypothetical protein APF76_09695 [Desulfitibacter sp. BRH_c19]|nr:MAG: hypothetical protein APF76_09695 [Desulfitibacter sp. BRH_c19]